MTTIAAAGDCRHTEREEEGKPKNATRAPGGRGPRRSLNATGGCRWRWSREPGGRLARDVLLDPAGIVWLSQALLAAVALRAAGLRAAVLRVVTVAFGADTVLTTAVRARSWLVIGAAALATER